MIELPYWYSVYNREAENPSQIMVFCTSIYVKRGIQDIWRGSFKLKGDSYHTDKLKVLDKKS